MTRTPSCLPFTNAYKRTRKSRENKGRRRTMTLHLTGPALRLCKTSRSLQPARQVNAVVRRQRGCGPRAARWSAVRRIGFLFSRSSEVPAVFVAVYFNEELDVGREEIEDLILDALTEQGKDRAKV